MRSDRSYLPTQGGNELPFVGYYGERETLKKLKPGTEAGCFQPTGHRGPAVFSAFQQQAIEQAARWAGFEKPRLLAEPEARRSLTPGWGAKVGREKEYWGHF